ncbi:MAG TPA: ABC transporter ATP-binding protein [Thermomicrobiales bacterium]|nr:ABC transporter ATP-binding protein [Thermomicrobiales bacterium]
MAQLLADNVTLSYGDSMTVIDALSLRVPEGAVTSIIGPNGCGKSTLLRALSRLLAPRAGTVILDGEAIHRLPTREVARRLCLMPQHPSAPESITVEDLVRRGRYPHQSLLQPPSRSDQLAVERALELAGMVELRERPIDELSGGQRQRAWIAMALAQDTPLLLLDEPTTYLDIAHQQEVLDLVARLNREEGRTVVMVLHDINNAAQVSDHVVAMRDGRIVEEGSPAEVLTPELLRSVFGVACDIVVHPDSRIPVTVPRGMASFNRVNGVTRRAPALRADGLSVGYNGKKIVQEVDASIPEGKVTAIVGPNGCGKSTLLRAFARLLEPMGGVAYLGDREVGAGKHREFARRLAMLTQGAVAPEGVLVEDLVAIGRYPYQRWWRQWSDEDQEAVDRALAATGTEALRWRPVDTLSGGQRQRVWLAAALAQQTGVLLLDEPTTFLDIAHQVEVLDLVHDLNRKEGRTIVLVLHDLCQACRWADHLIAMKDGRVVASGAPREVISEAMVHGIFNLRCRVVPDPLCGTPLVLPSRERTAAQPAI